MGNTDNILVDIGTGYHVKKNIDGTIDFLDRRNKVLRESVDKLQEKMGEMTKTFDVLTAVINEKGFYKLFSTINQLINKYYLFSKKS